VAPIFLAFADDMLETVQNDPLVDKIKEIQEGQGEDFWSFKNAARRTGAHALIHYPAMMVPTLQGKLLDAIKAATPDAINVLDPFVGSGTILVEAMSRGMNFTGVDINPLATLACLTKSGPYFVGAFDEKRAELLSRVRADGKTTLFTNFEGQTKWFSDATSVALSKIARGIELEDSLWARRLFWLALAKVVRLSCNSRMSTYKLHAKKEEDVTQVDAIKLLANVLESFAVHIAEQHATWTKAGLLQRGRYTGEVDIQLGDSRKLLSDDSLKASFDVVMTSPPYGDNTTTIPYGQYSYLPMKWIATEDVGSDVDLQLLTNTHAIDTASLGGSRKYAAERGASLAEKYDSARSFSKDMALESSEFKRFAVFFADLEDCLDKICNVTKKGGYQTWTIGNRHLGGRRVPMEDILNEMLATRQLSTVGRIRRSIHAKKMATRNSVSATMSTETVLLARKS
jgi:site-specific DNA-methyltransferase (cytosine-N4-specific)